MARSPSDSGSPIVRVSAAAQAALVRGHPWVWRNAVVRAPEHLDAGQVVLLQGPGNVPIGQGLWDPASAIAVRVYSLGASPRVDDAFLLKRVTDAMARRDPWIDAANTSAFRLCNGEGDRVPGLVLDRYGHVAIARLDGLAISARFERIAGALFSALEERGIRSFAKRRTNLGGDSGRSPGAGAAEDPSKLDHVFGETPPDTIEIRENGMVMLVDLARGQKTGAFLDQRDNRDRVRRTACGRTVLNLFSYAGGFSLAAALGGAVRVTSVDIAHAAHRTAQHSMRANGVDPANHDFVTADVFSFLEQAAKSGRRWDFVISDPPSFAPNEKSRPRALTAYRRLHRACAAVLAPDGILCAASCSSHISAEDFLDTLDDRSLGSSDRSLVGLFGPPADHPTVPGWPEGRYLKFAVLK